MKSATVTIPTMRSAHLVISEALESVVSAVPCPADIAHLKASSH
jgi:hypothetical protein